MITKNWLTGAVLALRKGGCASTRTASAAPKLRAGGVALVPARHAPERLVLLSPEQAAPIRAVLDGAADQRLQIVLAIEFAQHGADRLQYRFAVRPGIGPGAAGEDPNYRTLLDEQIRSVVELSIRQVSILMSGAPPQAQLAIDMTARVVQVDGALEPWTGEFWHRGDYQPLAQWRNAECRLVAAELDRAVSQLAQQAADALLHAHR